MMSEPDAENLEYITTADGARIACKRKPRSGARPIVFVHGIACNADLWDVPRIEGPDYTFVGLPTVLHEAGYDIWLMNLRGCGAPHMLSEPPPEQEDWCVDHFILYDLPAVVEHVRQTAGRRPFVIGNSMGAMTTAGWLQGATLEAAEEDEGIASENEHVWITASVEAARERQKAVAGAIFVEFPAALRWPKSLYDDDGKLKWRELMTAWQATAADVNYPFEMLSRMSWLQAILGAVGEVRLDWIRPTPADSRWWKSAPAPVAETCERIEDSWRQGVRKFVARFKGAQNFRPETFERGLLASADHFKAGVLDQMGKSVRAGAFVSDLGAPDHVYSDHYGNIELPSLVIAGGEDRIANADVTRAVFFERIASVDKSFHCFEGLAHGDFEYAPAAGVHVFPLIRRWIDERDKRPGCA